MKKLSKRTIVIASVALGAILLATVLLLLLLPSRPSLKYELNEDGTSYCVTGPKMRTKNMEIEIPAEYKGKPVTSIGDYSFSWCGGNIKSITMPESIISIGEGAFSGCSNLTGIVIPNSVTNIGAHAFSGCSGLTNVIIPNSVTNIGEQAFQECVALKNITLSSNLESISEMIFSGCTSLTSITIPESITNIEYGAFANCDSLENIHITNLANWCSIRFGVNPFSGTKNFYLNGELVTELVIPEGVTKISDNAFSVVRNLTSVSVPDSVNEIAGSAFKGCKNLSTITIGSGLTTIGITAFFECSNLTSIIFNGTTAQWNAVQKGERWNYNTGSYTIYCTDGIIAK